jgi:hypothetical protein
LSGVRQGPSLDSECVTAGGVQQTKPPMIAPLRARIVPCPALFYNLFGHLIDGNLWEAARRLGGTTGAHQGVVSDLHAGGNGPTAT